ncbi:hypothetical protein D4R78_03015 [bacterium]|nr:MAG: hypothetical protein D4R78_03015 [bacterium]
MILRCSKGQSILEYTVLLGVIIGIIVVILWGTMKTSTKAAYEKGSTAVENTQKDATKGVFQ